MDQTEYLKLADEALAAVAKWLETLDPNEVDYIAGDGVLTIEFSDGVRYLLSRQETTLQLWLVAGDRAFHFNRGEGRGQWMDEHDDYDFHLRLSALISEKICHEVEFSY